MGERKNGCLSLASHTLDSLFFDTDGKKHFPEFDVEEVGILPHPESQHNNDCKCSTPTTFLNGGVSDLLLSRGVCNSHGWTRHKGQTRMDGRGMKDSRSAPHLTGLCNPCYGG